MSARKYVDANGRIYEKKMVFDHPVKMEAIS